MACSVARGGTGSAHGGVAGGVCPQGLGTRLWVSRPACGEPAESGDKPVNSENASRNVPRTPCAKLSEARRNLSRQPEREGGTHSATRVRTQGFGPASGGFARPVRPGDGVGGIRATGWVDRFVTISRSAEGPSTLILSRAPHLCARGPFGARGPAEPWRPVLRGAATARPRRPR